jgi:hypothetical protein
LEMASHAVQGRFAKRRGGTGSVRDPGPQGRPASMVAVGLPGTVLLAVLDAMVFVLWMHIMLVTLLFMTVVPVAMAHRSHLPFLSASFILLPILIRWRCVCDTVRPGPNLLFGPHLPRMEPEAPGTAIVEAVPVIFGDRGGLLGVGDAHPAERAELWQVRI